MKLTLDTNVLYQALRNSGGASYRILQLVRNGYCRLALSLSVFAEYEEVLTRPESLEAFALSHKDVVAFLRYIAYIGDVYKPTFLFRPNLRDEDDNMFVELAVVSQSKYFVTSNLRDFCSGDLILDNFKLITPADFVKTWRKNHEQDQCHDNQDSR